VEKDPPLTPAPKPAVPVPQAPGAASDTDDFTLRTTFKFVMVPVSVTRRDGTIVGGLSVSDFRLLDNNKPQNITEDVTSHPLSVVMVIQADAKTEKMLPQIQKTGSLIQSQLLGDEGEVALMMFDHRIQKLTDDFTADPAQIDSALKKLKSGSSQARLNDATIEAVRLLKTRPASRRRAIILIGESRDNGSELHAREVLSEAEFSNVVIYSVNMSTLIALGTASPPVGRSPLDNLPPGAKTLPGGNIETPTTQSQNAMGNWMPLVKEVYMATKAIFVSNPLEVYTGYTGGREFRYNVARDMERALTNIGEELHNQYLLTYTPNNQNEAGFHNIVVQVSRPDLKIRARDGYYLAGEAPPSK